MLLDAVIFDMDETLTYGCDPHTLEEVDIHYLSWVAVLGPFDVALSWSDYCTHMRGATNIDCESWLATQTASGDLSGVSVSKEQYYRDSLLPVHLRYRPGVDHALTTLKHRGIPLALLTNAPSENVDSAHKTLDLWQYIEPDLALNVDSLEQHRLSPKPAPDGLIEIARRLQRPVSSMVYIGDSLGDMRAAKAAAMPCVGIVSTNSAETLQAAGATACIHQFDELIPVLDELVVQ